jgi:hypothetical protein
MYYLRTSSLSDHTMPLRVMYLQSCVSDILVSLVCTTLGLGAKLNTQNR